MSREYTAEQFEAVIPTVESLPLREMRQAIYAWRLAVARAARAREQADTGSDPRVARFAAHRARQARASLDALAGAAAAWTGGDRGRLFVSEREEEKGYLLLTWGGDRPPEASEVAYGEVNKRGAGEKLRLGERELLLAIRAVDEVIGEREHRALALKVLVSGWDDDDRWRLATGWSIGDLAASAAGYAEIRMEVRA